MSQIRTLSPRRDARLAALATALTLLGLVLGVVQPPWLIAPLHAAVAQAGVAAPLVYLLLLIVASPLHLNGLLMALAAALWPLPVALLLSYTGCLLGCLLTMLLLIRLGGAAIGQRDAWPPLLRRLATQVTRRPVLVGLVARVALGSGVGLEAFYLLTGYPRRQYLLVTLVGVAVWVAQTVVGVTLLNAALRISAGLAIVSTVVPVVLVPALVIAIAAAVRRRRHARI